ncbi:hypothetical protein [Crinalium epipsammum]|uniref:hypothetical protein n=1 Tax=Crinalium epipsammum TaxID=241425 RepID=UPI0003051DEA|nr:hypothetical protein [Crinalium epipsammum]
MSQFKIGVTTFKPEVLSVVVGVGEGGITGAGEGVITSGDGTEIGCGEGGFCSPKPPALAVESQKNKLQNSHRIIEHGLLKQKSKNFFMFPTHSELN